MIYLLYRHKIDIVSPRESIMIEDWSKKEPEAALRPEVRQWLNENIGWFKWVSCLFLPRIEYPLYFCVIRFIFEADAMAFKLRWL